MIDSYSFGRIVVDGAEYTKDLIIFPDHVEANWWRIEGHKIHVEDIESILDYEPEFLVVGEGSYGFMKITGEAERYLNEKDIRVVAKKTMEACREYNELLEKGKRVVAALHLTC